MANPIQFKRLLKEVRGGASPVQRMKVLARAWRTLQQLSPTERASLATEVGIDGAEEIVERMASRYGRLKPAVILQALEKARGAKPQQLREFFRGLRDPRRRKLMVRSGLETFLSEPAEAASPAAPPEPALQTKPVPEPASPAKAAPVPTRTAATGAATVAAAAAGAALTAGAAATKPKAVLAVEPPRPEDARSPAPPVRVSAPAPAPALSKPEPAPVVRRGPASGPQRPKTPPTVARPPAPRPTAPHVARRAERPHLFQAGVMQPLRADDLMARIEKAGNLIRRLRVLRTHAGRSGGLSVEALRRLLDLFESQWAKRRALTALLEHQVPGDLGDALSLIDDLDSPAARRWCLGTILDKWALSEQVRAEMRARRRRPRDWTSATPDHEAARPDLVRPGSVPR